MWRAQCGVSFSRGGGFRGGGRGCYCHGLLTATWSAYCSNPLSKLRRKAKTHRSYVAPMEMSWKHLFVSPWMGLIDIFSPHLRYSLPVVIHLELASHDSTPSDPRIQLFDQQSLFCFHIPPISPPLPLYLPRKEFIVFWFDAGLDGIWPRLTGQGCGALGAVVQWWRSPWGTHQRQCSSKGCTVSSPSSALTGDWIHQLIIKPQISHVFWISWVGGVEQMTL